VDAPPTPPRAPGGLTPSKASNGFSPHPKELILKFAVAADLALIDNAAIGMDLDESAVRVHALGVGGAPQPEGLAALQEDIQVVMVVVMQPGRCTCQCGSGIQRTLWHSVSRSQQRQVPLCKQQRRLPHTLHRLLRGSILCQDVLVQQPR